MYRGPLENFCFSSVMRVGSYCRLLVFSENTRLELDSESRIDEER